MTINKKNKELIEELNKGAKPNETREERRLRLKELVKERFKKDKEFRQFIAEKNSYDAQIEARRRIYNEGWDGNYVQDYVFKTYGDAWKDPLPQNKTGERFFDSRDSSYDQDLSNWGNDKSKAGHVYLIQDNRTGLYKIGITKNMEKRMKQLGVGQTAKLIDDIFVADAKEREKQLHKKYKDARLPQTEYFNIGYEPNLDL